jgi:hypothetical protein
VPEIWDHNPHITSLQEADPRVEQIECHYPLIHRSDEHPYHCIHGFIDFLNERLKLRVRPREFRGDIHLSREEKGWKSQVHELAGRDIPFWIIVAGGKFDYTIKWWDARRYQQVVDHFRGKIQFVQVGEIGHYHPHLDGVIDLRGKTDLRQLVRLVYHAQGVLCGVTAMMHLAAAVETRPDHPRFRPAVVVAGGREPAHWEAYPNHQFIHTIGALRCCEHGGCWRARTHPLGDDDPKDLPKNLCLDVVDDLPRCMNLISASDVIRRIEKYFHGGAVRYLTPAEHRAGQRAASLSREGLTFDSTLHLLNAPGAFEKAARLTPTPAPKLSGRGILICGNCDEAIAPAFNKARALRQLGATLPIQICFTEPPSRRMLAALGRLRVEHVDLPQIARDRETEFQPWELRTEALLRCQWREVLLLDTTPLASNPERLFGEPAFAQTGALFRASRERRPPTGLWKRCGLTSRHNGIAPSVVRDRHRTLLARAVAGALDERARVSVPSTGDRRVWSASDGVSQAGRALLD